MVNLETAKSHLRVSHSAEDVLIQQYIDAATSYVNQECGIDIATLSPLPPGITQAVLLLLADYYEHREAHIVKNFGVNVAVENLLSVYRVGKI